MDVQSVLRTALGLAHNVLEGTMADVTAEQALWTPGGRGIPIGAQYFHILVTEDRFVQGSFQGAATLAESSWAGRTGCATLPPRLPESWDAWSHEVRVDLPAARQYAQAVYAATDAFLAGADQATLERLVGQQRPMPIADLTAGVLLQHVASHCGEISAFKGLQGLKGYPF